MLLLRSLLPNTSLINMAQQRTITAALNDISERVSNAHKKYCEQLGRDSPLPCLVAVSKTKPNEAVEEAYQANHRDFGENYVQELVEKSLHFKAAGYEDIRWHFIGHLQRNKVNNLLGAENLHVIETVNSVKLADALDKRWQTKQLERKLKVYAQVNTSGEENKHGCLPEQCTELVEHIVNKCPSLHLQGLMTIGSFDHDYSTGPNPDFLALGKCREDVCAALKMNVDDLQLSMGMSNDFEEAIMCGSTTVRVGSSIFGARQYKTT